MNTKNELDPYKLKAAEIYGVAYQDVTPEMRRAAKSAAFFDMYSPAKINNERIH